MSSKKISMTVMIDPEILEKLEERRVEEGRSRSSMVERILKSYFAPPPVFRADYADKA